MNEVGEKYLPIGTVVMLEGATKRLMITGFCAIADDNKDVMYDYVGVLYPEGTLSSDETALFNHDQIGKVYHMGLIDNEEKMFINQLKFALENANNMKNNQQPIEKSNEENDIPPIGPGLPGYVAPSVAENNETNLQNEFDDIPPIGPGLPGYVAPAVVENNETNSSNEFDDIPPIGPGLPGYVEPIIPENESVEVNTNEIPIQTQPATVFTQISETE